MLKYFLTISLLIFSFVVHSHEPPVKHVPSMNSGIDFIPNKGQWKESIQLRGQIPHGDVYFEKDKLTYVFYHAEDMKNLHAAGHGLIELENTNIRGHLFQVRFVDANEEVKFRGKNKRSYYQNYFLGKDKKRWKGGVSVFGESRAKDVWDGIDYRVYSKGPDLKYDFIVAANADPNQIKVAYDYLDKISEKHGNLYLQTSVNELIDMKPVAFQEIDGRNVFVPCNYVLVDNEVSFEFPEGYDKSKELIIDPQLIFSSYSGSTRDNWGFSATYDNAGNLYGAGITFTGANLTYPTTTGAFQTSFQGGGVDIAISKFNSTGTSLVYSTYLGGNRNEMPHSIVVNGANQLLVLGTSSSTTYPTTTGAYDTTYTNTVSTGRNMFPNTLTYLGSDIVVTKFSSNGTSLVASTYIGGTSFDGVNTNNLRYNYGDQVRGEIIVGDDNKCYVASTTESTNFPVTNGSIHRGGTQECVIFCLDSSFSNLVWSTYLGGNGNDAAYAIQIDNQQQVYVAGGTSSSNFPTTAGVINPLALGGVDGFVTVIDTTGSVVRSSRLGTNQYDQAYHIQLDDSNNVYVAGQTEGNYTVTPSTVYSNPFSGQFIHKMNNDLNSTVFSTVIGTGGSFGNVDIDISLSAFLVNQCDHIYLSGWGGTTNSPSQSTTTGLPVTSGAYKTTTDGNDFYLIVLSENADSLLYATFFGGTGTTGEHVDGGTSRFDKRGIVYQAVCAGCGGSNAFPTSPSNVWSSTNPSSNCNLGVIKFDLSQLTSDIGLDALTKVCIPGTITFVNNTNGGNQYFWDFGDGDTSNLFQPTHTYSDTGDFTVMLVVSDSLSCILRDTAFITVRGESPPDADADTVPVLCPGDSVQLQAYGGTVFQWIPNTDISNDTIANPYAYPTSNAAYTVIVGDSCGSDTSNVFAYDTAFVSIVVAQDLTSASGDDTLCKGESIQLGSAGGVSYIWSPPSYLSKWNIANPIATPDTTIQYQLQIWDQYNCLWSKSIKLTVEDSADPYTFTSPDTNICLGDSIVIYAGGGRKYEWTSGNNILNPNNDSTLVWPDIETMYIVEIGSKCFITTDTTIITPIEYQVETMPDTFACEDVPIRLMAGPGDSFSWEPAELFNDPNTQNPEISIDEDRVFYVTGINDIGCVDRDSLIVSLREKPFVSAGNNQLIYKTTTSIEAKGNGQVVWSPEENVECPTCKLTGVTIPTGEILFTVELTDKFGCKNTDDVLVVRLANQLYIPNSFSPNNDKVNDSFKPFGNNIQTFKMTIYNRWGDVIFITSDIEEGWDGAIEGREAQNGIYVWEIDYQLDGEDFKERGTLTLVR